MVVGRLRLHADIQKLAPFIVCLGNRDFPKTGSPLTWYVNKGNGRTGRVINNIQFPQPLPILSLIYPSYCNVFISVFHTQMLTLEQKYKGED